MKLSNRLYRLQHRSIKNINTSQYIHESKQKEYQKQLKSIELVIDIMYAAFKNNIKMQQVYLDLLKAHKRNIKIKGKDIKKLYEQLSQNKTAQITFDKLSQRQQKQRKQKQQNGYPFWTTREPNTSKSKDILASTFNKTIPKLSKNLGKPTEQTENPTQNQQKLNYTSNENENQADNYFTRILMSYYKRLYSRLVQQITKKLTYYIINKNRLYQLLISSVAEISKKQETILRRINDLKDTKIIIEVVRLVFDQNKLLEEKIYETLVDEGHVVSIDEFFRISGKMMEESNLSQRRISRVSIINKSLSTLSSKSSENEEQKSEVKKTSRFYEHHKASKQENKQRGSQKIGLIKKNSQTQKVQKNFTHIERIHKEIEIKYANALEKISGLIANNEEIIENRNMILNSDNEISQNKSLSSQNQERNSQFSQSPFERWKKNNQKRKTTFKKTPSAFQYFSSEFKKIINELDGKKGKLSFNFQSQNQFTNMNQTQNLGSSLNFNKTINRNSSLESTKPTQKVQQAPIKVGKISNQTISLANPINVARLLGKKFKTIATVQSSQLNNGRSFKSQFKQRTDVRNLFKIYENNLNEGNFIEILFDKRNLRQHEQQYILKREEVQKKLIREMKQRKTMFVNLNSEFVHSKRLDQILLKEIQQEYDKMITKNNNKYQDSKFNQIGNLTNINIGVCAFDVDNKKIKNDGGKQQISSQQLNTPNVTQVTQRIQPLKLSNLNKIYKEFTNPLNVKYGFYNNQNYQTLRSKLEKCQFNTLKLKKTMFKKLDQFVLPNNVTFGQNSLQEDLSKNHQIIQWSQNFNILESRKQKKYESVVGKNDKLKPLQNLGSNFIVTPSSVSTPKIEGSLPLNLKAIQNLLQQNLQGTTNLNSSKNKQKVEWQLHLKTQGPKTKKNILSNNIKSFRTTAGQSFRKTKQVYSTQRRVKIN